MAPVSCNLGLGGRSIEVDWKKVAKGEVRQAVAPGPTYKCLPYMGRELPAAIVAQTKDALRTLVKHHFDNYYAGLDDDEEESKDDVYARVRRNMEFLLIDPYYQHVLATIQFDPADDTTYDFLFFFLDAQYGFQHFVYPVFKNGFVAKFEPLSMWVNKANDNKRSRRLWFAPLLSTGSPSALDVMRPLKNLGFSFFGFEQKLEASLQRLRTDVGLMYKNAPSKFLNEFYEDHPGYKPSGAHKELQKLVDSLTDAKRTVTNAQCQQIAERYRKPPGGPWADNTLNDFYYSIHMWDFKDLHLSWLTEHVAKPLAPYTAVYNECKQALKGKKALDKHKEFALRAYMDRYDTWIAKSKKQYWEAPHTGLYYRLLELLKRCKWAGFVLEMLSALVDTTDGVRALSIVLEHASRGTPEPLSFAQVQTVTRQYGFGPYSYDMYLQLVSPAAHLVSSRDTYMQKVKLTDALQLVRGDLDTVKFVDTLRVAVGGIRSAVERAHRAYGEQSDPSVNTPMPLVHWVSNADVTLSTPWTTFHRHPGYRAIPPRSPLGVALGDLENSTQLQEALALSAVPVFTNVNPQRMSEFPVFAVPFKADEDDDEVLLPAEMIEEMRKEDPNNAQIEQLESFVSNEEGGNVSLTTEVNVVSKVTPLYMKSAAVGGANLLRLMGMPMEHPEQDENFMKFQYSIPVTFEVFPASDFGFVMANPLTSKVPKLVILYEGGEADLTRGALVEYVLHELVVNRRKEQKVFSCCLQPGTKLFVNRPGLARIEVTSSEGDEVYRGSFQYLMTWHTVARHLVYWNAPLNSNGENRVPKLFGYGHLFSLFEKMLSTRNTPSVVEQATALHSLLHDQSHLVVGNWGYAHMRDFVAAAGTPGSTMPQPYWYTVGPNRRDVMTVPKFPRRHPACFEPRFRSQDEIKDGLAEGDDIRPAEALGLLFEWHTVEPGVSDEEIIRLRLSPEFYDNDSEYKVRFRNQANPQPAYMVDREYVFAEVENNPDGRVVEAKYAEAPNVRMDGTDLKLYMVYHKRLLVKVRWQVQVELNKPTKTFGLRRLVCYDASGAIDPKNKDNRIDRLAGSETLRYVSYHGDDSELEFYTDLIGAQTSVPLLPGTKIFSYDDEVAVDVQHVVTNKDVTDRDARLQARKDNTFIYGKSLEDDAVIDEFVDELDYLANKPQKGVIAKHQVLDEAVSGDDEEEEEQLDSDQDDTELTETPNPTGYQTRSRGRRAAKDAVSDVDEEENVDTADAKWDDAEEVPVNEGWAAAVALMEAKKARDEGRETVPAPGVQVDAASLEEMYATLDTPTEIIQQELQPTVEQLEREAEERAEVRRQAALDDTAADFDPDAEPPTASTVLSDPDDEPEHEYGDLMDKEKDEEDTEMKEETKEEAEDEEGEVEGIDAYNSEDQDLDDEEGEEGEEDEEQDNTESADTVDENAMQLGAEPAPDVLSERMMSLNL